MIYTIDIIDTTDDTLVLQEQRTQISSPTLSYNGGDSVYQPILVSELAFNMLVADAADAQFIELFTANENRYKVILYDSTNSADPIVVWQGYLLPEQYSEPYKNGSLFVSFVATDRIGQLKAMYLPDAFYTEKVTIANLIATILNQTGYYTYIYYAAAISNAVADVKLYDLDIDISCYIDDKEKKTDSYTILRNLMKSLHCTLFQQYGEWYIVGINRWDDKLLNLDRFHLPENQGLIYIYNYTDKLRNKTALVFITTPLITMLPPLKEITTKWVQKAEKNLLPKKVAEFDFENPTNIYWLANASAVLHDHYTDSQLMYLLGLMETEGFREYEDTQDKIRIDGTTSSADDYIYLKELFYISANEFSNNTLSFELKLRAYVGSNETAVKDGIENGDYDSMFAYRVSIGGVDLFGQFSGNSFGDYEALKLSYNDSYIECSITIKKVALVNSGYIGVEINTPITHGSLPNPTATYVDTLKIDIDPADDTIIEKIRAIDYTKTKSVEVQHSIAQSTNITRRMFFKDTFTWPGITINEVSTLQELTIAEYEEDYEMTSGGYTLYYNRVRFDEASHILWQANTTEVWIQKNGTGDLIPIVYDIGDGEYFWRYITIGTAYPTMWLAMNTMNPPPSYLLDLEVNDKIWIGHPASSTQITDPDYLIDKWKRYGITENRKWLELGSELPHNAQSQPIIKIQGEAFGLIYPLDQQLFNWVTDHSLRPISISQNLTKGTTEITVLELDNTDNQDYE